MLVMGGTELSAELIQRMEEDPGEAPTRVAGEGLLGKEAVVCVQENFNSLFYRLTFSNIPGATGGTDS